jgi:hypothetical protein
VLHDFGIFFEAFALGVVEGAEAGEEVVGEWMAIGFGHEKVAWPTFTFGAAAV